MMKAQVDARKRPLLCQLSEFLICGVLLAQELKVCREDAGHSGSVLTKLCLFPGLQGS